MPRSLSSLRLSDDVFTRLDAVTAADRPRVGGKASNCAQLRQAGFPVPDGLAIPSDASDEICQLPAAPR